MEYFVAFCTCVLRSSHKRLNSVFLAYFKQNWNACRAVLWYMTSNRALFRRISKTVRYVSQRNLSHGVTTTRSVLSLDCSPDTVDKRIDSGVSEASKSSMVSRVICSAFSWASVTFCSASSINFLRTTYSKDITLAHTRMFSTIDEDTAPQSFEHWCSVQCSCIDTIRLLLVFLS